MKQTALWSHVCVIVDDPLAGWPLPPWLATPPPTQRDGWLGRSAFTLTEGTCWPFLPTSWLENRFVEQTLHVLKMFRDKEFPFFFEQQISSMGTPHQFLLMCSPPAKEEAFKTAKKAHGSTFAFQWVFCRCRQRKRKCFIEFSFDLVTKCVKGLRESCHWEWTCPKVEPSTFWLVCLLGVKTSFQQKNMQIIDIQLLASFSGSSIENWHSILRIGLINASGTKHQLHGAAYGNGIYLSPNASVSFGYSGIGTRYHQDHSLKQASVLNPIDP